MLLSSFSFWSNECEDGCRGEEKSDRGVIEVGISVWGWSIGEVAKEEWLLARKIWGLSYCFNEELWSRDRYEED